MAERRNNKPKRAKAKGNGKAEGVPFRVLLGRVGKLFALPVVSALALTLAFPPVDWSPVAYVALVPLIVGAFRAKSNSDAFWAALLGGLVFYGVNLYWVLPITIAGYVALMPYLALYWALFGWGVRRIGRATHVPLTLLAPVLWVALEQIRGWMISGLPWIYVGHTQHANLTLIQTADALGAYGASFLCLMTSGLVADLLVRPLFVPPAEELPGAAGQVEDSPWREARRTPDRETRREPEAGGARMRLSRVMVLLVALTVAAWVGTIGYSVWRLGQAAAREGPVVASIQTCVPQEVKQEARLKQIEELEEEMLADQISLTEQAAAEAKAAGLRIDLAVWPETMVPGYMNQDFLEHNLAARFKDTGLREVFEYLQRRSRLYWSRIQKESRDLGAPILFGAANVHLEGAYRLPGGGFMSRGPRFNTAYLVSPESKPFAADHAYSKVHLVPFGEYVPFTRSWPWLYTQLRAFTPYEYDYSITPGDEDQAPFVLRYDGREERRVGAPHPLVQDGMVGAEHPPHAREARFQVAICYEDSMAYRIRDMTRSADPARPKAIDFVVNISNDGWFHGSIELDQHLNLCVFRAIENRVAVVRSVNTGISALIAPSGRVEKVVERDGNRRYITGEIVGRLTLDDRLAPYTRVGDAFALACLSAAAALVAAAIFLGRRKRKESAT
jgi:apolipoprotein N-acyltransferase